MLSNAIAEMRTYGEGFIIADQAPGLMDMSVIRNTNTKIILRLPDQADRELVGRAANLNEDQITELAKLPCGVAAVYQNEWIQPVLCKVDLFAAPEKEITDIQKDAVEKFTSCEKVVNEAKNDVEKYVIKNGLKDMGMDSVDNIFKYVIPKTISVPKAKKRVVAIMCNFKFDMEHGMAIVFEDEKIKKIGPQDIVL